MRWHTHTDQYCAATFGCTAHEALDIPLDVRNKYRGQKHGAKSRGIEWEFTLLTWWATWQESGKWRQRGIPGYVMGRKGDLGPYSPENVYICTAAQNVKDSHISRTHKPKTPKRTRCIQLICVDID